MITMMPSRPLGMFSLLDEESKLPSSNDKTLVTKFNDNLGYSPAYIPGKHDFKDFKVCHLYIKLENRKSCSEIIFHNSNWDSGFITCFIAM